jgi:hypothetical protein
VDAEFEHIGDRLRSTPPSCVGGFRLTPAEIPISPDRVKSASVEWAISIKSVWRLGCTCGEDRGHVLGHPLHDLNPDYDDPEFVGPLGFECSACGKVAEIIDTDLHGYHVEVARIEGGGGSVKIRGEGDRRRFPCPACEADSFIVTVAFIYWPAAIDLFYEQPHLPMEEFFLEFLSYGRCDSCGEVSAITDFGKL